MKKPYTVVLIIPTGIGAAIGGYAGDGLPIAKLISQVCDRLITHPNVMNGASLYWNIPNALYVEGYALDKFTAGEWGLRPVLSNKVGLLLDQGIEPELMLRHLQVADAARATLGLNITNHVITDTPLNVEIRTAPSGTSWGTIGNPDSLLRGAEKLIIQEKAQAIAVVTRFPENTDPTVISNYQQGKGVDPIAGAEAVISHLLVRNFKIPCAHAPAFSPSPLEPNLAPRAAAEEIGYTFLPCVLVGLSNAPQIILHKDINNYLPNDIWANQIDAVIIPSTACGNSTILNLSEKQCLIITVKENKTLIQVPASTLGIQTLQVNSYLEAVGALVAHKAGINHWSLSL